MTIYKQCLLCNSDMILSNGTMAFDDGTYLMQCSDIECYFHLYYTKSGELYEYALVHPNGCRINAVVKDVHHNPCLWIVKNGKNIFHMDGMLLPFKYDLAYFDNKIKTILVFG